MALASAWLNSTWCPDDASARAAFLFQPGNLIAVDAVEALIVCAMFTVSLGVGALLYTLGACALIFGLSFYYDVRDRNLYESQRRRTIFHCIRCDKLYAARAGTETCECPRCHFKNARLTF